MKDKNGIEKKCKNCVNQDACANCAGPKECLYCKHNSLGGVREMFTPSSEAYEARIQELQKENEKLDTMLVAAGQEIRKLVLACPNEWKQLSNAYENKMKGDKGTK